MKKITSVLFTLLLAVWIVHYWHPIDNTTRWTKEVYTVTKKAPKVYRKHGESLPAYVVELDNGDVLTLSMEWTKIIKKKDKE